MSFQVERWGTVPYAESTARQVQYVEQVIAGERSDTLVLVEHPPIYTLGANFHATNLLFSEEEYARRGIQIFPTERGGDITHHAPGQLVIYPIFDLNRHGKDLHRWMRDLEETMILTAEHYGLTARRFPPNTGVWIGEQKLAAIGVKIRKWTSFHGIAINCENDLSPFSWIVPCGIRNYGVTSLTQATGQRVSAQDADPVVVSMFQRVFSGSS